MTISRPKSRVFQSGSTLPVSAQAAFDWHERSGAFLRLTPPWEAVRLISQQGGIRDGAQVVLKVGPWPWQLTWELEHSDYVSGRQFRDVQTRGPFALWEHTHCFQDAGPGSCVLEDHIEYRLPLDRCLGPLADLLVRRKLARLFDYRHDVTADDLKALASYPRSSAMKVLVSGASGMVGSALQPLLQLAGHTLRPLSRQKHEGDAVSWNPGAGTIDQPALEGFDAVIHLAGENIAAGRWSAAQKARIRDSRVDGTRLLSQALAKLQHKPRVLVCASAIGFYGNRGDEILDENSPPGQGFLADVCREWEAATAPAEQAGIRVVHLRFGVILSPTGGALAQMLIPFRLGLGGRLGNGQQFMSWITLDDTIGVIAHALINESLQGPVNAVSPEPVTNLTFTKTLGRVLGRPTIFPVPAAAARLLLGEMADALLLTSARVVPRKLASSGYTFRYAALEHALRHLLGKTIDSSPYAA